MKQPRKRNIFKIVLKVILIAIGIVILCAAILDAYLIIKPQKDAKKELTDAASHAMTLDDDLIGRDVKVIGFGEATHGNKEFQELKLEVLKNLVRDHGVGALCFEMDYGEGVIINDYISGYSDMTIEELFRHIAFGIYHTEQMKETIEWMKSYNDSSRDGKLSFYGFDLQNPESDLFVIKNFVLNNGILSEFDLTGSFDAFLVGEFRVRDDRMNAIYADLKVIEEELTANQELYADLYNYDRVLMCIRNVFKTKELAVAYADLVKGGEMRDAEMAENVILISEAEDYPIMITGHIGHIGYAGSYVKTMGSHLREKLGSDYFAIGSDYWKTNCNISGNNGRKNHSFVSADILAYQAKTLGTYYLRFDSVDEESELYPYIHGPIYTGSLGESYSVLNTVLQDTVRVYCEPSTLYDAMMFVYKATPLELLEY